MKKLYTKVIEINEMPDDDGKAKQAMDFFKGLNAMTLPDRFNWAQEVFEDIHVAAHPDKTRLDL